MTKSTSQTATYPRSMKVISSIGKVPSQRTRNKSVFLVAENGATYLSKCPTRRHQYLAANELIAARVAELVGLPVLHSAILRKGQKLCFGCLEVPKKGLGPPFSRQVLKKSVNGNVIYDILCFDIWLCNTDRHDGNILTIKIGSDSYVLCPIDHDCCLLQRGDNVNDLKARANWDIESFIMCDTLRDNIHSGRKLERSVGIIEQVPDVLVRNVIEAVPAEWLNEDEKDDISGFLIGRKHQVRSVLKQGMRRCLSNLRWR